MKSLGIIVPCYNEEEVIGQTSERLARLLDRLIDQKQISSDSGIYFIDDGSRDQTWSHIENLSKQSKRVHGVKLSRNFGHQNALLAGLLTVPGDMLVSIDADLQDDVDAIETMVAEHGKGAEIVLGVRSDRRSDSRLKRLTAEGFYDLCSLLGIEIAANHADFRLMSRKAVNALARYPEVNLFIRGIIPNLGFRSSIVEYERTPRLAGTTKYPYTRMISLALSGITSFSIRPLRLIMAVGFLIALASFVMGVIAIAMALGLYYTVPGWASTVVPMYFLGGIQLFALGLIGEYIGKIYLETKGRPRYIIEKKI